MTAAAVVVENLSKSYRLDPERKHVRDFRDVFADWFRGRTAECDEDAAARAEARTIWALDDVSFEIRQGEVVGLVGPNGAGKSTLLKILSRITLPTKGRALIRGRVGAILEVTTGFHPELSGRENVYLSGAHRGMTRREIDRKFDEIVAFSGVERFIDVPVKRYSSGMYVRLAFSVASSLESEVLLLDEVLAVGDAAFKAKCLERMEMLARAGRTVILCSHSLARLATLCDRLMVMKDGKIAYFGDPEPGLAFYAKLYETPKEAAAPKPDAIPVAPGHDPVRYEIAVLDRAGNPRKEFETGDDIVFDVAMDVGERCFDDPLVVLSVQKGEALVTHLSTRIMGVKGLRLAGKSRFRIHWKPGELSHGDYQFGLAVKTSAYRGEKLLHDCNVGAFSIGLGEFDDYEKHALSRMVVTPNAEWLFEGRARAA